MKTKHLFQSFLCIAGSAMLLVNSVHATQFWDGTAGGGDNNWNTAANWGGDLLPDFTTIAINFGSLSSAAGAAFGNVVAPTVTTTNNDLTAGTLVKGINFGNNGLANRTDAYTLQGNSIVLGDATNNGITTTAIGVGGTAIEDVIELNIDFGSPAGAQNRQFSIGAGHDLRIDGVISGGANAILLVRGNNGKLTLTNANNSYLGATNIARGAAAPGGALLEITSIADGNNNSSIGASSNAAANLRFSDAFNDGSMNTLRYIGDTDGSTDRLFRFGGNFAGTNSAIESSGVGTLSFTNTGAIATTHNVNRNFYLGGTNTGDNTFAPTLGNFGAGVSTFTKQGAGKWILTTTHTYTGATTVSEGKLTISSTGAINSTSGVIIGTASTAAVANFNYNSSTALTQAVSFASGSTGGSLSGTGTINSAVSITAGNTLSPGNSAGLMSFGSTLDLGGIALMEIDGATRGMIGGYDAVDVTGALTYGGTMTLDIGMIFGAGSYSFNLFDSASQTGSFSTITLADQYSGSLTNDGFGTWGLVQGGNTWSFTQSDGVLGLTVIPEPSSLILGAIGLLALLRRRRR